MPLRKGPNILIPFGLSSDRDESLPIYYPWPDEKSGYRGICRHFMNTQGFSINSETYSFPWTLNALPGIKTDYKI
jgi:hypothetical protein